MDSVHEVIEQVKAVAYPLSAAAFALYPVALLLWTIMEGRAAQGRLKKVASETKMDGSFEIKDKVMVKPRAAEPGRLRGRRVFAAGALLAVCAAALPSVYGFVAGGSLQGGACGASTSHAAGRCSEAPAAIAGPDVAPAQGSVMIGLATAACMAGLVAALKTQLAPSRAAAPAALRPPRHGRVLRLSSTSAREATATAPSAAPVKRYTAPPPNGVSLWHDVQLKAKDWLDQDTGLFHYVNEMPLGCLQKFEVQPHVPENAIEEDPKGSSRLAAFGKPVPFNYGCFPQTYRDPMEKDELFDAPGDDDPLDVLDLGDRTVGVGRVVRCRPLGAVCLIDEGQADWKVLAVNVDSEGPLADCMSIEDVERVAPGRVQECLQWIDDFKQSSGKGEAKLHFQVHDQKQALSLLEADYKSWQRLVAEAGPDGLARGHWIQPPKEQKPASQAVTMKMGWASPRTDVPGQLLKAPSLLVNGAARVVTMARARSVRTALTQSHEPTTPPSEDDQTRESRWARARSP